MKNNDLSTMIANLEKQIQYLQQDYKTLLNRYNTFNDLTEIRMHIKQAEESLRLRKKMR